MRKAADIESLLAREKDDSDIARYVICEHGAVVGMINFWRAGEYFGTAAVADDYGFGYFLAPSARGRGLVTQSLSALMAFAREALPVKRFIAFCEADNVASGAVLRRVGFTKTEEIWEDVQHGWIE